ncbi:MAG TPA: helix-turn-helix transcriptional regulator [Reyranella sp.]|nr:helix-turn-helix transcriptional regulator [Reyranella sp.]
MKKTKTIDARAVHEEHMARDSAYRVEYDALEEEFALVNAMIRARARADLSQAEVAKRMGTTESVVSRLESGRGKPSTRTLERYAKALGHRLRITFEPMPHR